MVRGPYFVVGCFAWVIYWLGAQRNEQQRKALMAALPLSMGAATLVLLGGFFDDTTRVVLWVIALLVYLASTAFGGSR